MEVGKPLLCPVCGEEHAECSEAVLGAMSLNAYHAANERLSERGRDALKMIESAADVLGVTEAWEAAENVEELPAEEVRVIEFYLARKTLIEAARKELYEPPKSKS
jgi:hypothetical protein